MGQYYNPYVEDREGVYILDSWHYDSGSKLMEHSWLGNNFVNAVYTLIDGHPSHVGWIGDYSDDVGCDEEIYKAAWGDGVVYTKVRPNGYFRDDKYEGYLINYTKEEYVDIAKYAKEAVMGAGWIINPLPLLTAIGNGQGGGDYRGANMEMVGYWFMDEISYERELANENFADITEDVVFQER